MWFVDKFEVSVHVPIQFQAAFIGKGGEHVTGLQKQSGCRIDVGLIIKKITLQIHV